MLRGNLKELNLAYPPQVLELKLGDICRVATHFDYSGPAISATLYVAIGRVGVIGFDEILHKSKSLSIPLTPEPKTYESYVDIYITSPMKVATGYDVYAKLINIPGPDLYSPTYENIIDVVEEAPPPGYTLEITVEPPGTGTVTVSPFKATYAQGERVTLTANPASGYEFDHWGGDAWGKGTSRTISITMDKDMWIVAAFREAPPVLRTLEVWIDPVGAGYVTTDPEPSGGTQHNWQFPHGTTVYVTAHSNPGYVFYYWSGEMTDTPEITAPVYPMTEHRRITAHFKEEVAPPPPPEWTWWTPGKYTQIGILAPSSAPAGSVVEVEIGLKNVHSTDVNMWPGRTRYNTTIFRVYDAAGRMHVVVAAGDTHSWFGSFTMPSRDIKILVESWYEGVDKWYADYSVTKTIKRL